MKSTRSLRKSLLAFAAIWIFLLACRVTDGLLAQGGATATVIATSTRARPTFTAVAYLIETPTDVPQPPTATRPPPPTPRPATRAPTLRPATAAPPPPTPDPQGAYYYKYRIVSCVPGDNTRVQGTVTDNGRLVNGITVRVTADPDGDAIDQKMTGVDPSDPNHIDPSLLGKYRLGIAEGARTPGNWWVFIVGTNGAAETAKALIHTDEYAGCNTATINWVH